MPKRIKCDGYSGVFYREVSRVGGNGAERMYYVVYKKDGKLIEAKAGGQYRNDMTPARANKIRSDLLEGRKLAPQEERKAKKAAQEAEANIWTIERLWSAYKEAKPNLKGWAKGTYQSQYGHLADDFAKMQPKDILPLDVKRLELRLLQTRSPQLVKHVLKMLRILCNFGQQNGLCPGLCFKIKMPTVNNEKTEDLTPEQLRGLLEAIKKDTHPQAGPMMLMALYTGMRAGELMRLRWADIDFARGFIRLKDPKGGIDQSIPLNDAARALLEKHRRRSESPVVFPGRAGEQRTRINKAANAIKKAAGLPQEFRPLHGLRHVYASMLASSGQVDMYVLQRLLTHKSPLMTQRYAHLRDDALRRAADIAGLLIGQAAVDANARKEGL